MDINKPEVRRITYEHKIFTGFGKIHMLANAMKARLKKNGRSEVEAEQAAVDSINKNMQKLREEVKNDI